MTQEHTAQRMLIISDSEITAAYGVSAEADDLNTISSCSFTDDIESALCDCELREVLIDIGRASSFEAGMSAALYNLEMIEGDYFFYFSHGLITYMIDKLDTTTDLMLDHATSVKNQHELYMIILMLLS